MGLGLTRSMRTIEHLHHVMQVHPHLNDVGSHDNQLTNSTGLASGPVLAGIALAEPRPVLGRLGRM